MSPLSILALFSTIDDLASGAGEPGGRGAPAAMYCCGEGAIGIDIGLGRPVAAPFMADCRGVGVGVPDDGGRSARTGIACGKDHK